jgi:hypothetical protein
MRPKLIEKTTLKEKESIQKSLAKLSKDRERDEALRKRHP